MDWEPQGPVPVFPLPGVVLFPHAELPLHIFELRYRTLVRDAISAERDRARHAVGGLGGGLPRQPAVP